MTEVMNVARKYLDACMPGQSEVVLMGDREVVITTYYYQSVGGKTVCNHITSSVKVETTVTPEQHV